jgi:hypothetical protein
MSFDVDHRMIRVDPHLDRVGAAPDFNGALFKCQLLLKSRLAPEGVGRQLHPHAPELNQLSQVRPRIGLGHQQHYIAVLLGPNIGRNVSVANRHGVVFIFPGRCPDHVVNGTIRNARGVLRPLATRTDYEKKDGGQELNWGLHIAFLAHLRSVPR